jgi:hypothetical protein
VLEGMANIKGCIVDNAGGVGCCCDCRAEVATYDITSECVDGGGVFF